jgi:GMP synthase-like glutamine amidotransferase
MPNTVKNKFKRICFVGMLGTPGSFDASVYDHYPDTDDEGSWFITRFGGIDGFALETCNISHGDPLPDLANLDGIILGGSHNSVHDNTEWQQRLRDWLPILRAKNIPILAICGSHQLLAQGKGASVERFVEGPYAGTLPIEMTPAGQASELMKSIPGDACFQFGNSQHVTTVPKDAVLLAGSGRNPVAVLDFGNHCYATQFHPECTHDHLSTIWKYSNPSLMGNYFAEENGYKLVANFFGIVAR